MWRTGRSKQSRWLSTGRRACSTTRSQLRATTTSRSLSCVLPRCLLGESQFLPCCSNVLQQSSNPTYFLLCQWCQSPVCWKPCSPSSRCHNWLGRPAALSVLQSTMETITSRHIPCFSIFSPLGFLQAWSRACLCYYPTTARWRRRPDRVGVAQHHCPIIILLFLVISKPMYFRMKFLQRTRCFGECLIFQ